MRKSLIALLAPTIISTTLIGCMGEKETTPSKPQTQQEEHPKMIYFNESEDGSVLKYFNETGKANLQGLENVGRVEDYRVNQGEVYRLTDQQHEVIGLKRTNTPFAQPVREPEPEKPKEPDYITREDMELNYLPEFSRRVEEIIKEHQHPQKPCPLPHLPHPGPALNNQGYNQQSDELPLVPIKPPTRTPSKSQSYLANNQVDIMSLPPPGQRR